MTSAPAAALPSTVSEFHAYAFSNACLRVYTIVSLRDSFKKDAASQTEASRGLHWEMAALFDHLSQCKMFGPVPIPTAVVPMLQHYTTLYEQNPNPTVDIHAFPFEYNEFMSSRVNTIQGNRWWDPLLEEGSQGAAQSQPVAHQHDPNQSHPGEHTMIEGNPQPPAEQAAMDALNALAALQQTVPQGEPNGPTQQQQQQQYEQQQPANAASTNTNQAAATPEMSTAANPAAPFFSVTTAQTDNGTGQGSSGGAPYTPPAYRAGPSRFIPYQPPSGASAYPQTSVTAPPVPRQAILAPPVKAPPKRKKTVKTSEYVDDDGAAAQSAAASTHEAGAVSATEQQAEKENGGAGAAEAGESASQVKKRTHDIVKTTDYVRPHDGAAACGNCITHGRKCLTSKDARLKRCLECRVRQSKCIWPVPDGTAAAATNGTAQAAAATAPAPPTDSNAAQAGTSISAAPAANGSASAASSSKSRPSAHLVAEVVVTPVRRGKRKAADALSASGSPSKRSMRLRGKAPGGDGDGDDGAPTTSGADFEARMAAAQGDDAYLRSKMALLVDMARTAEMRLADVLTRVAELEAANRRMEKMIAALGGTATASPKRK